MFLGNLFLNKKQPNVRVSSKYCKSPGFLFQTLIYKKWVEVTEVWNDQFEKMVLPLKKAIFKVVENVSAVLYAKSWGVLQLW